MEVEDAKTTALSTALAEAQAEYLSALTAGTEILYLRALLERLGIAQKTQWGEVIG